MRNIQIIIPTYNAGACLERLFESIQKQENVICDTLIIDSESIDSTLDIAKKYKVMIKKIRKEEFNHGKTREMGVEMCNKAEIVVFLTQDAILSDEHAIAEISNIFANPKIGCAYGRQLPHAHASILAAHARLFNYSAVSRIKSIEDIPELGIKTAFISNSFAAYRKKILMDVGGFPENTILSEDTYVAAKMLLNGWKVAYCAEAKVYHSHNYTMVQEFKRYFDIGVFHSREPWIRREFGQAEGEGRRFVLSELRYVLKHNVFLLPSMIIRSGLKFLGYRFGIKERFLFNKLKMNLSMYSRYWK
jgi:rhamnosyltransferase